MDDETKKSISLTDTAVYRTIRELRQVESRYRRLFESARDGILLINSDTALIEDVNPYLVGLLGYSLDELLGEKLWEVGLFADDAVPRAIYRDLQNVGYAHHDNLLLQAKSGEVIPVEFVGNTYDCEGIRVIQCNIRDISERKKAEAYLGRLTNYRAALGACNKAILHSTSESLLLQEVCRVAVEYADMKLAQVCQIDPVRRMLTPVAQFGGLGDIASGDNATTEVTYGLVDSLAWQAVLAGQPHWCQDMQDDQMSSLCCDQAKRLGVATFAALPLTRSGVVTGAFCLYSTETNLFDQSARDLLTELAADISFALDNIDRERLRNLTERRLAAAEGRFRSLVEQASVGIYIIQEGVLKYVNPCLKQLAVPDSAGQMLDSDPLLWIADADRDRVAAQILQLRDQGTPAVVMEFDLACSDGTTVAVDAHAARAVYEDRRAIIGVVRDISERKRSELASQRYIAKLKAAVLSTVDVAMTIGEMRDPYTAGHERRVADLAVAIAVELGFDSTMQEGLSVAGHLHDVGKIMVPSEILTRSGKLSEIEMQLIRGHCQAGYDIVKSVDFPWPVAEIILQHHERLDGSGYPRGLTGAEILREAQVLAIADVVEAMSSHRPYRPGKGMTATLAELERGSGTEYASDAVRACVSLFRDKNYQFPA